FFFNAKLKGILSEETVIKLTLQFLSDLIILKKIKQSVEMRNGVCHSATIYANAIMHAGTTVDTFLRENLYSEFPEKHVAFYSVECTMQQGRSLMSPYLPQNGTAGGGIQMWRYGLFRNLLKFGRHIADIMLVHFLGALVIQHGAFLGLGSAALGTADEEIYDDIKNVLYTDSVVAGEAAGIDMGLLMVGTASEKASEMLAYAHETQHEKIIRGLALGIALTVYGREEEADTLIEQMTQDQDHILHYGGMYALAMAYRGTKNNKSIHHLLHFAISNVSDDIRRTTTPRIVSLLSESYNPHVRYGAAMAVGISCAGIGLSEAISLLEPLTSDVVDFVHQGALIAMSMVMIQTSETCDSRVGSFRYFFYYFTLLLGFLMLGGRNVTIRLFSKNRHDKVTAVVGLAVLSQFWHDIYEYILMGCDILGVEKESRRIQGLRSIEMIVPVIRELEEEEEVMAIDLREDAEFEVQF
ncbi:hypothetical protein MKX03_030044, partial [Papaver bracteatum]